MGAECAVQLEEFSKLCMADLRRRTETVRRHAVCMKKVLACCGANPTSSRIRAFLSTVENPFTYNNYIKSLRVYFRLPRPTRRNQDVQVLQGGSTPSEDLYEKGAPRVLRSARHREGKGIVPSLCDLWEVPLRSPGLDDGSDRPGTEDYTPEQKLLDQEDVVLVLQL
ncbi:MAG: hypothetical protein NO482_01755 [Candidatus Methanomethylicia archaeon]|jgi:hypothetical protein|nr:hypothetical protein [Candidatus Methanomethylicia archaeon]